MVDQVTTPPQAKPENASLTDLVERRREEIVQRVKDAMGEKKTEIQDAEKNIKDFSRNQIAAVLKSDFYFQSEKDNFGFIYKVTRKQIKFSGYFFKTEDKKLAAYINRCYGDQVTEIDKEDYEDGTQLKPGAPEPVKSSIVVNRLPERNT